MKAFRFLAFLTMAVASAALIIIGMATLNWYKTTTTGITGESHIGLRRYYQEINGDSQDSQSFNRQCTTSSEQCDFYTAGSWALGWGIAALALITIAVVLVSCLSFAPLFHGMAGKMTAATLMFLAGICILVGALTYDSHLPDGVDGDLSWSFILFCIGGGLSILTSILLCAMPTHHYVYTNNNTSSRPVIANPTGIMVH